ncbi:MULTISPECIES: CDP-glucose 4,6-dehydratase [unclassified Anabaena]|uniref:CDP-glucose 4,6-dehydratase n=1 Tax=unclassified Anabaena TaxID=2619674 RepID=UPI001448069D|nr:MULTISPECIES: CDP-glucose 4,6-dehydratase [unclassified Anabaena]MTJ06718.1 CDP-glucose 4,6-dehydratase [Anabaena sp. UHCC 0204]MTJ55040.1 CDP-glucose 4,6-dehydratase [Anabaena sp. UHCC 0253]
MKSNFWHQKKVFVTGHTGFKGGWLSMWLQMLGAQVCGYSLNPPTSPNLFELAHIADGMTSVIADVRELDNLQEVMQTFQPDIVIHLAAQPLVRESYQNPVDTYAVNVMGTVNVLEAVRSVSSVRAVVSVTSDKCYENREWIWGYRETDPMGGHDPYSSSKGCAELVTTAYRQSFFNAADYAQHKVAIASVRAGNVIGGGDWAKDRLIPDILRAWLAGEEVVIRNPQAVRPWQHVLEPLHGYLMLAEKLFTQGCTYNGGWNFGPSESGVKTVAWILEELQQLWGNDANWIQDRRFQPHEANLLTLDCSKARNQLDWEARLDLKTALAWIVDWHKTWQQGDDMKQKTQEQIQEFMQLSKSLEQPMLVLR